MSPLDRYALRASFGCPEIEATTLRSGEWPEPIRESATPRLCVERRLKSVDSCLYQQEVVLMKLSDGRVLHRNGVAGAQRNHNIAASLMHGVYDILEVVEAA